MTFFQNVALKAALEGHVVVTRIRHRFLSIKLEKNLEEKLTVICQVHLQVAIPVPMFQ